VVHLRIESTHKDDKYDSEQNIPCNESCVDLKKSFVTPKSLVKWASFEGLEILEEFKHLLGEGFEGEPDDFYIEIDESICAER